MGREGELTQQLTVSDDNARTVAEPTTEGPPIMVPDELLARVAKLDPKWHGALLDLLKEAEIVPAETVPVAKLVPKQRGSVPSTAQRVYGRHVSTPSGGR